jgi:hypothetical protein
LRVEGVDTGLGIRMPTCRLGRAARIVPRLRVGELLLDRGELGLRLLDLGLEPARLALLVLRALPRLRPRLRLRLRRAAIELLTR